MITLTASQRAVLAEHGIATSNRGVIARVVAVLCETCQTYVAARHVCPAPEAVAS